MQFTESIEFGEDAGEVWTRVSDVEKIPQFWHGTKSLQLIEKKPAGRLDVKIRFAFGGSGNADISVDNENHVLVINYYSGPVLGLQKVTIDGKQLIASWDVKFTGLFRLASGWNERHFRSGTIHALERLTSGRTQLT